MLQSRHPDVDCRLVYDKSRSGAKIIYVRVRDHRTGEHARPTDAPKHRQDHEDFVDRYPTLFPDQKSIDAFLEGDESAASNLYGEIPSTFPTILFQVDNLDDNVGEQIDVALATGGANDVDLEDIINPEDHRREFVEYYDPRIRDTAHDSVTKVIKAVRAKCPRATILYFGLYAPGSYASNRDAMAAFFRHETESIEWYFNEFTRFHSLPASITESLTRAWWFRGRFQYWSRQALVELARDDAVRGPGLIYVPSTFKEENAAFASDPLLWDDYDDPTTDPAREARLAHLPRYNEYRTMPWVLSRAGQLLDHLDGPTSLLDALRAYLDAENPRNRIDPEEVQRREQRAQDALKTEIRRIQHAMIASMGHPNGKGAYRYAEEAFNRYLAHEDTMRKVAQEGRQLAPPALGDSGTYDSLLKRTGLRTQHALAADVTHLDVDSIALVVKTSQESSKVLGESVHLRVTTKSVVPAPIQHGDVRDHRTHDPHSRDYLLTFHAFYEDNAPFKKFYPWLDAGAVNRFTIDTMGELRLDDIVGTSLILGGDPHPDWPPRNIYGLDWKPEHIDLEINGINVHHVNFAGQRFRPRDQVDLGWPAPVESPPTVVPPAPH